MSKTRIAFVGTGFMGQIAHLRNYVALPDCEVVALAEPRPNLREAVAARYGIARVFPTHRELLDHCEMDGIVASQPYSRHAVLVPDLLERGVAVFTEKPIAVSVQAAERLAAQAAERNVLYMVGYHKRSDPAMEYAAMVIRRWKESGEVGRMRLVRASMPPGDWVAGGGQGFVHTGEEVPPGDHEPRPADMDEETFKAYDAFVNYYIHQVNALRFLLGEPYRVTYADRNGVLFAGESASGVCATLEMAAYHNRHDWRETYLVGFERGAVEIELPAPLAHVPGRVRVMRDTDEGPGTVTEPLLPRTFAMLNQAANFVAAVRGERPAPCAAAEAVEDLRVARDYIRLLRA